MEPKLYSKIAVALHDELGRVPKEKEIDQVFLMARVLYKAVLGLHYKRQEQKKNGQLVFHIFGALAEFEPNLIKERTIAGLEAARARGRLGGRPPLSDESSKVAMAKKLHAENTYAIEDICKTLNISRATLYRYISGASGLAASRSRS